VAEISSPFTPTGKYIVYLMMRQRYIIEKRKEGGEGGRGGPKAQKEGPPPPTNPPTAIVNTFIPLSIKGYVEIEKGKGTFAE